MVDYFANDIFTIKPDAAIAMPPGSVILEAYPEGKRAFHSLKGGGWYETDFKKDNQRNLAGDESGTPKKDTTDKKDKKPADKGKSKDAKSTSAPKSGSSGAKAD